MVAAFSRMDGRFVIDGKLGCPICSTTYEIRDGVADLRLDAVDQPDNTAPGAGRAHAPMEQGDQASVRAAALLGLSNPNSLVILVGAAADLGGSISEMTEARIMAVNPVSSLIETERVAVIRTGERFPFASNSVDGVMLDKSSDLFAADAGRILRQGGRLVGPATLQIDGQLRELARDETNVVAESVGQLISLSR